jgi:hypothetical protein
VDHKLPGIAPAAATPEHVHDPADHAPVIGTLDTTHILRQMRLNPCPLLVAQPVQISAHDSSPIRINIVLFKHKN